MAGTFDILFNPKTDKIGLMLARDSKTARSWQRKRFPRKPEAVEGARVEGSLTWVSWHTGDTWGRVMGTGTMPPVAAEGDLDGTHAYYLRLPPGGGTLSDIRNPYAYFEFADYIWCLGQDSVGIAWKLFQIDPATLAIVSSGLTLSLTAVAPTDVEFFDGSVYFAFGFDELIWRLNADLTITQPADALAKWGKMSRSRDRLYFTTARTSLRSNSTQADPFDSRNWSGVTFAGDSTSAITDLTSDGRVVYVGKEDGAIVFDEELQTVNVLSDLQSYRDATNLSGMIEWHGQVVMPHVRGLFLYGDGVVTPAGPETERSNTTAIRGQFRQFVQDGQWLHGLLLTTKRDGTGYAVKLMSARPPGKDDPGGTGALLWRERRTWESDTVLTPTDLCITSLGNIPRLFIGIQGTASQFFIAEWIALEPDNAPPPDASSGTFKITGTKTLPTFNCGQPFVQKYLKSAAIDLKAADAGKYATVYFAREPRGLNPTWEVLGTANESGFTELPFPANVTVYEGAAKLELTTDDPAVSPLICRFDINYAERPKKNNVWVLTAQLAEGRAGNSGAESRRDPYKVLNRLYQYEEDGELGRSQVMVDPNGQERRVLVLDVDVGEWEEAVEGERTAQVKLTVEVVG